MMPPAFKALDIIPKEELEWRWSRCRQILRRTNPSAGGLFAFSRTNIYYLAGTAPPGILWLPLEGKPVLLLRRGMERARLESPHIQTLQFRSYKDIAGIFAQAGSPLTPVIAAEMNGLSWGLGASLASALSGHTLENGDKALVMSRGTKSAWELKKMRVAGKKHHECLHELLPKRIKPGMTELAIAHELWKIFFKTGHFGLLRMENYGEEVFMGHVSAGDSGNYPSIFNGPLGLRGMHPAIPHMGSAKKTWKKGQPLTIDTGFVHEGYCTDKTQVFWPGKRSTIPAKILAAHQFCIDVQTWLAEQMKPGAIPSQLYEHVMLWAEKEGWTEGFMALGSNKVRFLGHGIGLVIDEYPVIAKGFDDPLEEGMVFALEPKMGIPGVGMVGVENTFEVTERGGKCLTGNDYEIVCV